MTDPTPAALLNHKLLHQLCAVLEHAQRTSPTPQRASSLQHLRVLLDHAQRGIALPYDDTTTPPELADLLADLDNMREGSLGTDTATLLRLQTPASTIADVLRRSARDQRLATKQAWLAEAEQLNQGRGDATAACERLDAIVGEWTAIRDLDEPDDDLWSRFQTHRAAITHRSVADTTEQTPGASAMRTDTSVYVHHLLRNAGLPRSFSRGQLLIAAGDPSEFVLMVETGSVKVVLHGANGVDVIREFCGAGSLLGELGVIDDQPRSASVVARTHGIAVYVDATAFRELMRTAPELTVYVNALLRKRMRDADQRQLLYASSEVSRRVAQILLNWALVWGVPLSGGALQMQGVTQLEIAQFAIASVKTVDHVLRLLRSDKLLETGRRNYVVPDPQLLQRCLDDPDWRPGRGDVARFGDCESAGT